MTIFLETTTAEPDLGSGAPEADARGEHLTT